MSKLIEAYGLEEPIRAAPRGAAERCFGTCAGMIVLAAQAVDGRPDQRLLGLIDIDVRRNAYGRQVASFEAPVRWPARTCRSPACSSARRGSSGSATASRSSRRSTAAPWPPARAPSWSPRSTPS